MPSAVAQWLLPGGGLPTPQARVSGQSGLRPPATFLGGERCCCIFIHTVQSQTCTFSGPSAALTGRWKDHSLPASLQQGVTWDDISQLLGQPQL